MNFAELTSFFVKGFIWAIGWRVGTVIYNRYFKKPN